ncbi:Vacuolar calcium ion transporter [Daldinia childiae]|uniref:Vacuolar calcium ion transporter n=1 Tax=Daldinia childiae TaxID=326645 RepID=UPI0014466947|nr:Vacuolar calcium ion transporter [Daldinia childiae]KAF3061445.1 Vacuolar calcium ion transporter [Daldinia childiae]
MDRDSALPSFQSQIRKTVTGLTHTHPHQNGEPNENTSLLRGNGHSVQNGSAHQNGHGGGAWEFFFDSQHTPGTENPKPWVKYPAHTWHITKATLLSSPVNILLVAVPIGIIAGQAGWDPVAVFVINFFAIIPLAAVLSYATEEISVNLGEALGGLLNATFGNAVELIVSIIALRDRQIEIVKSSMIGSILSNLLLVLGAVFPDDYCSNDSFLMTLSAASMILPGTLFMIINGTGGDDTNERNKIVLSLSRGTAIILLVLYVLYLWFQLRTHHKLFSAEAAVVQEPSQNGIHLPAEAAAENIRPAVAQGHEEESEEEEVHMSPWSAGAVLIVTTVLVAICADYLVESIDSLVERAHISRSFIGLILIPIVGNAAEHVTAVVVAVKNKMDLAMGVAIGSSIQIALFVTPFLVVLGWIMDRDMDLHFETFETVSFALAVLVVIYTVQDGKSNYLEGAMLMALYVIIALAFFVTPSQYFNTDWVVGKLGGLVSST